MKILNPSIEIIPQSEGIEGIYKQVELAGRTCYQSFENITEDSAKQFVDRMIKSGHGAMLEHRSVYLYLEYTSPLSDVNYLKATEIEHKHTKNKYSKVMSISPDYHKTQCYITTNLRVLVENGWLDDLEYICEPTEYHEKRITVKFITDQGILREFTRHKLLCVA